MNKTTMHTLSGKAIDFLAVDENNLDMHDIAHALHQINRFNGHAYKPYSVLSHSMCASYLMPEGKKMEGLLHDAAEAYIGDITTPAKNLWPDIVVYEDKLLAKILRKYDIRGEANIVKDVYRKSPVMKQTDTRLGMGEHEVLRPLCVGEPDHVVLCLMQEHWDATPEDFIERYLELGGKL